jgi:uncharacterized protein
LIARFLFVFIGFISCMPDSQQLRIETLRLMPGEDVYASLQEYAVKEKIEAAYIATAVGSLTEASIRFANQEQPELLKGHFEITSLVGTLSINGSHVHITLADENGNCKAGHLTKGSKVYTTVEVVIGILPNVQYLRELDSTYGYKELVVRKK